MRIVIDLQGSQSQSRFRGIGRYSMSIAKAIARNAGEHEVIIALSDRFPETIMPIRDELKGLVPNDRIVVFSVPGPVDECNPDNSPRARVAELIREHFLISLRPDVVLVTSLFEGFGDDFVSSIQSEYLKKITSVIVYDLIPLLNKNLFLTNSIAENWYMRKIDYLKDASLLLSISEYSRQEAIDVLKVDEGVIVNISTANSNHFLKCDISNIVQLKEKYNIKSKYIMHNSAFEERKNFDGLLKAYALLPQVIKKSYSLVLVGKKNDYYKEVLVPLVNKLGLSSNVIFTDYVDDKELLGLFSGCSLFVFPSFHEGFGLPALEAMACGAPTIGSNCTSIPEVIGREDALFDPYDVNSITRLMQKALTDEAFRKSLIEHGLKQAKKFSWDTSAQRAIEAFEEKFDKKNNNNSPFSYYQLLGTIVNTLTKNPSDVDLCNIASSIEHNQALSKYRQLFVDVSEIYKNDAATGVQRVVRSYLNELFDNPPEGYIVKPVYASVSHSYRYADNFASAQNYVADEFSKDKPIIYQRGDIFYALDMQHYVQLSNKDFFYSLRSAGVRVVFEIYDLLPIQLINSFYDDNLIELHKELLAMIVTMDSAVSISKATADAYKEWILSNNIPTSRDFSIEWVHIGADIENSKPSMGLPVNSNYTLDRIKQRPSFLSVGTIEPRKGQEQTLEAFDLLWEKGIEVNLVLVGRPGWKMGSFIARLTEHPEKEKRLFWLDGISDEYLELIYSESACLIAASINEGFGLPLIEAAHHKLPIIARDIPVFREVAGDHAYYFKDSKNPQILADTVVDWLKLYNEGKHINSIEMPWSTWSQSSDKLKSILVKGQNCKQLLVDISELVQRDAKTGIQRVVRSILKELLENPPDGYIVKPVYTPAGINSGFYYANEFLVKISKELSDENYNDFFNIKMKDEPVDLFCGDIFLGLDFHPDVVARNEFIFKSIKNSGVQIFFVVYDLLPFLEPQFFPPGSDKGLKIWLRSLSEVADGVVCISRETAAQFDKWLLENSSNNLKIDWFHLGADIDNSLPTTGLPKGSNEILMQIGSLPTFLTVGTIEPRKKHMQALEAFEKLWQQGFNINLVIVGKQGWMVEKLVNRLRKHPELNKRLFWLDGISDEYLEKIYEASTCLIAASEAEGFGLPLIEAAQHKLPIIARDIPVFQEVAGRHAFYFENSNDPVVLAEAVKEWLTLYNIGEHIKSDDMPWLTWAESARMLINTIINLGDI